MGFELCGAVLKKGMEMIIVIYVVLHTILFISIVFDI